jgi:hypothetical protein
LLAVAAVLTGAYYIWSLTPDPPDNSVRHMSHRYFAWQAEGWLAGRLDLPRALPAGFRALPDPYDPAANRPFRMGGTEGLHDLSLYHGKLYLYWGPVPTLVAFLPWRVLTGQMLSSASASCVFAFGAWLASAYLLARVARAHFPATRPAVLFVGYVALAMFNWAPIVLRRASVWETPIFAACFFGALTWWLLAEFHWAARPMQWRWLAAASLAWGLAVGSRPIWIVGSAVLLVPLWLERSRWRERDFRRLVLAAAVPVGLCVLGVLIHNMARFGNPLEFGQRWQLAEERVTNARLFAPEYAGFNLRAYLFSLPRFVAYFPFVLPPSYTVPPKGHFGTELAYGLLVTVPWFWLALFAPRQRATAAAVAPVAVTGLSLLAILLGFAGVTARYQMEIAMPLALLAAFGLLAVEARENRLRWVWRSLWIIALAVSSIATVAINTDFMGQYAQYSPRGYESLARVANRLAVRVGWSPREATEAVELTVVFPPSPPKGHHETLVATGVSTSLTIVFAQYDEPETVRFLLFFNGEMATTPAIRFKNGTPHMVLIELGGMLPPPTHPFWQDTPPSEIARRRGRMRLSVDGLELLAGSGPQVAPADARPEIGTLPPHTIERRVFTGRILHQRLIRAAAP